MSHEIVIEVEEGGHLDTLLRLASEDISRARSYFLDGLETSGFSSKEREYAGFMWGFLSTGTTERGARAGTYKITTETMSRELKEYLFGMMIPDRPGHPQYVRGVTVFEPSGPK